MSHSYRQDYAEVQLLLDQLKKEVLSKTPNQDIELEKIMKVFQQIDKVLFQDVESNEVKEECLK